MMGHVTGRYLIVISCISYSLVTLASSLADSKLLPRSLALQNTNLFLEDGYIYAHYGVGLTSTTTRS